VDSPVKVIILDSNDAYRRMICAGLATTADITVVGEVADGPAALLGMQETRPAVILVDVTTMEASAPRLVARMRAVSSGTGILVLHEAGQEQAVFEALREGALGHLVKGSAGARELAAAIRLVSQGKAVLSPGMAGRILDEVIQEQQRT
jgi:DNA-binding NarL/FixJ family response regulator